MTENFIAANEAITLWRDVSSHPDAPESFLIKTSTFLEGEDEPTEVTICLLASDIVWLWSWACLGDAL